MDINTIKKFLKQNKIKHIKIQKIKTLSGHVFKIICEDDNYFLKVFEEREENKALKIKSLYELFNKKEINAPKIILYEQVENKIYLLMSQIKGKMLQDVLSEKNYDLEKIYYDLGKIVAKIHSITFEKFGETLNGMNVQEVSSLENKGPFNNWNDMHLELVKQRLSYFKNTQFEKYIKPIINWFETNKIKIKFEPVLLHEDLNKKNIFVKNNKISGIIDVDDSYVGHNEEELMRIENAHFSENKILRNSFLKGYQTIKKLDSGYEERRSYYYLSRLLVHIKCVILYQEEYIKDIKKEHKKIHEELIKYIN